jgi:serine/threonine protein kinase
VLDSTELRLFASFRDLRRTPAESRAPAPDRLVKFSDAGIAVSGPDLRHLGPDALERLRDRGGDAGERVGDRARPASASVSALTEPTGLRDQRYELLGEIGSGGQGVVYRAFDHWTERPVAIKVLASKAAREPQAAERLSREQQALNALKGTAAVEVLDVYRGREGELCLVMELLTGTTLDAYLQEIEARNERMELFRIAEIFDPIVATLETAHQVGILHRDLKPANVFLLEDGGVRLLDFGMTRLRTSAPLTAEGTVMGSPSFMAPEAWKGQSAAVDHRADVYSLGVILFRVLAGALPFSGLSLYEKMIGSTKGERPSLHAKRPDLPRDVDEWVHLALAIDREQRFQNVRALWNAFLATFHVDPPGRAKRPSLWAKAAGTAKRLAGLADAGRSPHRPHFSGLAPAGSEPSMITQALRRSIPHAPPEPKRAPAAPPVRPNPAPTPVAETTLELSDSEFSPAPPSFQPVEKTLELSGEDLLVEDAEPTPTPTEEKLRGDVPVEKTLPTGARVESASPDPHRTPVESSAAADQKKKGRSKRRRKRRGRKRR